MPPQRPAREYRAAVGEAPYIESREGKRGEGGEFSDEAPEEGAGERLRTYLDVEQVGGKPVPVNVRTRKPEDDKECSEPDHGVLHRRPQPLVRRLARIERRRSRRRRDGRGSLE
jgi:hypothetical protein